MTCCVQVRVSELSQDFDSDLLQAPPDRDYAPAPPCVPVWPLLHGPPQEGSLPLSTAVQDHASQSSFEHANQHPPAKKRAVRFADGDG